MMFIRILCIQDCIKCVRVYFQNGINMFVNVFLPFVRMPMCVCVRSFSYRISKCTVVSFGCQNNGVCLFVQLAASVLVSFAFNSFLIHSGKNFVYSILYDCHNNSCMVTCFVVPVHLQLSICKMTQECAIQIDKIG